MLFLVFQLGKDRYAIEAHRIIEILHLVNLKQIPRAPAGVAGVFDYHGEPVPLIDLTELAVGKPSRKWMSTRIILVKYPVEPSHPRTLGLIAEHATNMIQRSIPDFMETGVESDEARYLGRVTNDGGGLIQWIEVEQLLTPEVRNVLFRELIRS